MENKFEQLLNLLKNQVGIVYELMELGKEQVEALKDGEPKKVISISQKQEETARRLKKAEEDRQAVQRGLEEALNMPDGVTLSRILPYASSVIRRELKDTQETLRDSLDELRNITDICRVLSARGLQVSGSILALYSRAGGVTYGPEGMAAKAKHQAMALDRQI